MDLVKIDKVIAEQVMGYIVDGNLVFDGNEVMISFKPTTNISDAFKIIEMIQNKGYAWHLMMYNVENEVEAKVGRGISWANTAPLAICKATLKHYCIEIK